MNDNSIPRKTNRIVLVPQARDIISKVYDFMKNEANIQYAERLQNARWRTAQATGVSSRTVTRVLREKRALAKKALNAKLNLEATTSKSHSIVKKGIETPSHSICKQQIVSTPHSIVKQEIEPMPHSTVKQEIEHMPHSTVKQEIEPMPHSIVKQEMEPMPHSIVKQEIEDTPQSIVKQEI